MVKSGEAWLADTEFGRQTYHFHGPAKVTFDLNALRLEPGYYRLGLLARTGTRWESSTGQIEQYRLSLQQGDKTQDLGQPALLPDAEFAPLKAGGEPGAWANWYGAVYALPPVKIEQSATLTVENLTKHGGVLAIWALPLQPIDAIALELDTGVKLNTFIEAQPPQIKLRLTLPEDLNEWRGFVRMETYDLLTDSSRVDYVPISSESTTTMNPQPLPGVFNVEAALVEKQGDELAPGRIPQTLTYAYAPAKLPNELPDDWPLAAHVDVDLPVMPGFKWFRYFAPWASINPAPGIYDWAKFDEVFAEVKELDGKLLVAGDGAPTWTSSRGKTGVPWDPHATAYPPDDWGILKEYLTRMLEHYQDNQGTLAAIELFNEANTEARWQGSIEELVTAAKVFRSAIEESGANVDLIGIAVSAGHQRTYVNELVEAGILKHVDAVSGHWYEEMMSYERETPINNLPRHVELLKEPMKAAGTTLPILNTETGIQFANRDQGRLVTQTELNGAAEASPDFDPKRPWITEGLWRVVSERRAAATYVNGTVALMGMGVERSFYFSQMDFTYDGAASLPWVALGQLGHYLDGVDYHEIETLKTDVPGSSGEHGQPKAMAYRLGAPDGKQVIIAWTYLSDQKVGRSKHWQPWLEPIQVRAQTGDISGTAWDLYGRHSEAVTAQNGWLELMAGEEPVFVEIAPKLP